MASHWWAVVAGLIGVLFVPIVGGANLPQDNAAQTARLETELSAYSRNLTAEQLAVIRAAREQGGPTTYGDALTAVERSTISCMSMNSPPVRPSGFPDTTVTVMPLGSVTLSIPSSCWTYGCSATSAGMMFAYYDRNSHPNLYTGPANGGVCPLTNLGQGMGTPIAGSCSIIATMNGFDGRTSRGHVDDYWIDNDAEGPDPWEAHWTEHTWGGCTADFMGTSQWKWDNDGNGATEDNTDGATSLWSYDSASRLYDYVPPAENGLPQTGLCHGLRLFAESRGYTVVENYTQKVDARVTGGFSFADYKAEIDAGRPVMIQVTGHSMVGVGYADPSTVYLHDTWDNSLHSMTWGGSYEGRLHQAMTVLHLETAALSTPSSVNATDNTYGDKIRVTWSAVSGATHYRVSRATSAGGAKTDLGTWQTGASYDDNTATAAVTYYYWVRAATSSSGANASAYSAYDQGVRAPTITVSATDASAGEPGTGLGSGTFTFSRSGSTAAALTVSFTVGGTATAGSDYTALGTTVGFAAGAATATKTVAVLDDATAESYETVVVTLSSGTGYTVGSPSSATVNISSDDLGAPSGVIASDGSYADRVLVSWNAATGATSYWIYRNTANASATASLYGEASSPSFTDTRAEPGVTYYYWVKARNGVGTSGFSNGNDGWRAFTATTVRATDGVFFCRTRLSWTAVPGAGAYKLYRAASAGGAKTALTGWTTDRQHDDKGGALNTIYYYFVQPAANTAGLHAGPYSAAESGHRSSSVRVAILSLDPCQAVRLTAGVQGAPAIFTVQRAASEAGPFIDTGIVHYQAVNGEKTLYVPCTSAGEYFRVLVSGAAVQSVWLGAIEEAGPCMRIGFERASTAAFPVKALRTGTLGGGFADSGVGLTLPAGDTEAEIVVPCSGSRGYYRLQGVE